jgi:4-alpha-glucanotransferase
VIGREIRAIALEAGIATDWVDAGGQSQNVSLASQQRLLAALELPCSTAAERTRSRGTLRHRREVRELPPLITATVGTAIHLHGLAGSAEAQAEIVFENGTVQPTTLGAIGRDGVVPPIGQPGYHRLRLADREIALAVAPQRCVTMADIAPGERLWGLAAQIYALRRPGDGGIGDATAVRELAESAARHGSDAIALSPVHSLFAAAPAHHGPYSPSSRLFLNALLADPATVFGEARVAACGIESEARHALEAAPLVDWPVAGHAKYVRLRCLFESFAAHDKSGRTALAIDFERFVQEGGQRLREHALFEALHHKWADGEPSVPNWTDWPAEWRDPSSSAIANFRQTEQAAIEYHMFLQWLAARSFADAQGGARQAGMRIGLISDLAIGMDRGGSHAWARQSDLLMGLDIGAPPDSFNARGQDWGLAAFSPNALVDTGFEPFLATVRAAMRHAGGLRIDHVMGLMRLWMIPHGAEPSEGAYLAYPFDDLLRLVALESHRHGAVVIGEDLGTVPPELRARLSAAGIAGMDVLWFQRDGQDFLPPAAWRSDAVAMTTTHDLPTVAGWWSGADLAVRREIGAGRDGDEDERTRDRASLWQAFVAQGVEEGEAPPPAGTAAAVDAALKFVARTPAPLALVPVEDILGLVDQPNVPGTIDEHPNWRRRLMTPAANLFDDDVVEARLSSIAVHRR